MSPRPRAPETDPPRRRAADAVAEAVADDALACADRVLAVVPGVMDLLRSAIRAHVGEQLSVPQFRCLNFIALQPGSPVGAVAAFLGVTMPTASAMVDRLVRAGAVRHDADPADRRRSRLQVTPAGQAQLTAIRRGARQDLARGLAGRSPEELRVLMAGLGVMQSLFAPAAADPAPADGPTAAARGNVAAAAARPTAAPLRRVR